MKPTRVQGVTTENLKPTKLSRRSESVFLIVNRPHFIGACFGLVTDTTKEGEVMVFKLEQFQWFKLISSPLLHHVVVWGRHQTGYRCRCAAAKREPKVRGGVMALDIALPFQGQQLDHPPLPSRSKRQIHWRDAASRK